MATFVLIKQVVHSNSIKSLVSFLTKTANRLKISFQKSYLIFACGEVLWKGGVNYNMFIAKWKSTCKFSNYSKAFQGMWHCEVVRADAKRTPSYSSDLHFVGIIIHLSGIYPHCRPFFIGHIAFSTFLLVLELFRTYFWTY